MILGSLVLLAATQDPPAAKIPDPALFDALARKTNASSSFVAEYQAHTAGQDESTVVRILYRAPDSTKIVFGTEAIYRIHDGFLDMRATRPGEAPIAARVAVEQPILDRFHRLATAMRTEFPAAADDWSPSGKTGIRFDLSVGETAGSPGKALQFTASYACPRPVLFGWLEGLARKPASPMEGDRLVFDGPIDAPGDSSGMKITLSTTTGFIERVEQRPSSGAASSFELAALDLSPKLDDAAFALPERPSDAVDASAFVAERLQQVQTQNHRRDVFAGVAKLVADRKIEWDAAARSHLALVLGVIHADSWKFENEIWIEEMRRRMEQFAAWLRDRLSNPALADADSRGKLEAAVADWRRNLSLSAGAGLDQRLSDLTIDAGVTNDEALRKAFLEIERESVRKTFRSALVEPLEREFDQKIAQARLGK